MSWVMNHQGVEIYYEITGSGTPIVFQSGYMGIHDIWKYVVEKLSKNHMCITHDNRGYGMSGKPEHNSYYTMEQNAEDLKAVMDAVKISEPVLIATHSMGASIAFAFALKYPELVKGIIALGGAAMPNALRSAGNEEMWSQYQITPSSAMEFYHRIGLEESIASEASKWTHNAFTKQARAILNFNLSDELVNQITVPIEVLHSISDNITPVEQPKEIEKRFPNAKVIWIDGCKHFPPTEMPDVVTEKIEDFLADPGA